MNKPIFYSLLLLIISPFFALSQPSMMPTCRLSQETEVSILERLKRNKKVLGEVATNRSLITFVPVKIHLVADDAGEGRMSEARALDMLCLLNEEYLESEIQFYLQDLFSYVDNSNIYLHTNFDSNPVGVWNETLPFKADSAINIFVTNSVDGAGSTAVIMTLAYYTSLVDCIFIRLNAALGRNVLPHAMGHFFSLIHPFIGWEGQPFCEGQVSGQGCDDGLIENQSGSNCETTGDLICDTPPDYLFAFCVSNCEFDGVVYDCEGNPVFPMENNTMSYFGDCPDYEFTEDQTFVMLTDLFSPERDYVNPGITPNLDLIEELPELNGPEEGDVLPFNALYFNWEPIAGATHYILEIDELSNFNYNLYSVVVDTTEAFVTNYGQGNTNYYWRVRGFNNYGTCSIFSVINTFQTSGFASEVKQISAIKNWSVQPNPLDEKALLYLSISANLPFQGELRIQSVSGKALLEKEVTIVAGTNTLEIPTMDLPKGIYLVSIQHDEGLMTKKLLIQ
jgi:Secretion system C-terminal sorting domain